MTCKDCLHYESHKFFFDSPDYEKDFDDYFKDTDIEYKCPEFTPRSEWLHLLCKVGDKVWYIHRKPDTLLWNICETEVHAITLRSDGIHIYVTPGFFSFLEKEIGKKLFLIREEAEKHLEEQQLDELKGDSSV